MPLLRCGIPDQQGVVHLFSSLGWRLVASISSAMQCRARSISHVLSAASLSVCNSCSSATRSSRLNLKLASTQWMPHYSADRPRQPRFLCT